MRKLGLDQTTAWILAVLGGVAVFGAGYLVTKRFAHEGDAHEAAGDAAHGEGHGEAHGEGAGGHEEQGGGEGHGEGEATHGEGGDGHEEKGGGEGHGDEAEPAEHHGAKKDGGEGHGELSAKALPAWEYKGSAGPEHWGELAEGFKVCGAGKRQSPIDIDAPATDGKLLPIRFSYKKADVTVRNNGHTVQADYPMGNYVEIDGERYDLVRLDLHAPSEHKVAGIPYDLELQLVHKNPDGQLAVVSLLFEEAEGSRGGDALKPIFEAMPTEVGAHPEPVAFDASAALPKKRTFYRYAGSLTTPPCSEGVTWLVLSQPLEISPKQVDRLVQLVRFNARPVQPLNGRRVAKSTR